MLIANEETNKINRKQNNVYITIFANLKNLQVAILKK